MQARSKGFCSRAKGVQDTELAAGVQMSVHLREDPEAGRTRRPGYRARHKVSNFTLEKA